MRRALAALVLASLAAPALAAPRAAAEASARDAEAALTECLAQSVLANPGATAKARLGQWQEAAAVMGFICRSDAAAMMAARDALDGRGSGLRRFKGAYFKGLPRALSTRLAGELRQDYAHAEPPPDGD